MASDRRARWRSRSRELVASAKRLQERTEARFPVITNVTERMLVVNIFDSATRLAAQCFLTAVPLLFVVASFAPASVRDQMVSSVRTMFGLTGQADDQLKDVFDGSGEDDVRNAVGAAGAVIVLLSATAVSRAMQRLCRRAWQIPRTGTRIAIWRWFVWIAAWMLLLIVQGPVRDGFGLGLWLGIPLTLLFQTGAWWWSQHLLLGGLIRWPPLLPGALLTAAAVTALSLGARVYMPIALNRALTTYGSTGSVFVILSWLIVLCVAVAIGITTGAALAQEPYLSRRLGSPVPGERRARGAPEG
ncbi:MULTISPECIES: YhjD/YihY/BrkB family envelope integrity protein [unclassified Streptomyces]|uniref:YhjD/YihY/BrkB family envelope integrity protein n=1 Tax=unclassified Streptomyces TaxID=2593676 RepID=UPI0009969653|nr:YhjD/YihY/BrkB family envelope integrity protein [Streptomyces sp. NRRL S-241]